jgi:hypothetical protein
MRHELIEAARQNGLSVTDAGSERSREDKGGEGGVFRGEASSEGREASSEGREASSEGREASS